MPLLAQALTFNGADSYVHANVDTRKVPFGQTGSFKFRTRDRGSTLMALEVFSTTGNLAYSMDIQLAIQGLLISTHYPGTSKICLYAII